VKFTYVTAEYGCIKGCSFCSQHGSMISLPHLAVALVAASAFCLRLLSSPLGLSWFRVLGVFAGEALALFLAGFPVTLIHVATEPRTCRLCGAHMSSRGRHFTSSKVPRWSDWTVLAVFMAINICVWLVLSL